MHFPRLHRKIFSIFEEDFGKLMKKQIDESISDNLAGRIDRTDGFINDIDQQLERIDQKTDSRFNGIEQQLKVLRTDVSILKSCEYANGECYIPYNNNEKIRIMFLFQAASFWPSWEYLYKECINDSRFDVTFTLMEENYGDTTQMLSARTFLNSIEVQYIDYSDELFEKIRPHIAVIQSPYDEWHRNWYHHTDIFRKKGARVIYITYGIEITDTEDAHKDHFLKGVNNCWRVYTFSERMRADYLRYCPNPMAIRAFGHPKFDSYYHYSEKYSIPQNVKDRIGKRKIVLWHLHFPKFIPFEGKYRQATPYLSEYASFLNYIEKNQELFFIIQMHPKFFDQVLENDSEYAEMIKDAQNSFENVYLDKDDDYRPALVSADYIISDRSALIIEASVLDIPICYMSNPDYSEEISEATRPLFDSYVQGHDCSDMISFIEDCKKGLDINKDVRNAAFNKCIRYDGQCSRRIKDDLVDSLKNEYSARLSALEEKVNELSEMIRNER